MCNILASKSNIFIDCQLEDLFPLEWGNLLTIFHLFFFFFFFFFFCWIPKGKSHREHFFVSIEKIQTMCKTYKYKQPSWGQDYRTWNTECWIFYQQNTPNSNFWLRCTANVDVAARQTDVKTDGQCNSDRYTDGRMTDTQHDWQKDRTNSQTTRQTDGRTDNVTQTDIRTDEGRTVNMTDRKIGQTSRQYDRRTDGRTNR